MQSTCKDIKKYPKLSAFHQDYFLTCIKNIKNIHILQYLLYLCKVYPHFRKSDSALGKIYIELRIVVFILKAKNIYP